MTFGLPSQASACHRPPQLQLLLTSGPPGPGLAAVGAAIPRSQRGTTERSKALKIKVPVDTSILPPPHPCLDFGCCQGQCPWGGKWCVEVSVTQTLPLRVGTLVMVGMESHHHPQSQECDFGFCGLQLSLGWPPEEISTLEILLLSPGRAPVPQVRSRRKQQCATMG